MAVVFPTGFKPFIFSDTLERDTADVSAAILDQHIAAFDVADVNAAIPAGAAAVFLTFVVFAYPDPANTETAFPKPPLVELLPRGVPFDGRGAALRPTPVGTAALDLGGGLLVNYSYRGLGAGVFQIVVTPNTVQLAAVDWRVRFTVVDGVTGPTARLGLTLTVGTDDARTGWLAVPGQAALSPDGPPPFDMGGALRGITLAGAQPADPARKLRPGSAVSVAVPLANYGAAPFTVAACQPPAAGHFDVALPAALLLPPGGRGSVTLTYRPPEDGEIGSPAAATRFTLLCDDPAAGSTHFNTLAVYASAIAAPSLAPSPQFSPPRGPPFLELEDGETVLCEVTLRGRNLLVGDVSAVFGDVPAESISASPDGLVLGVPALPPGRVAVTVTTEGGSVTSTDLFTVVEHPEVDDFSPFGEHGEGPAGRILTILGKRFLLSPGDTVHASARLEMKNPPHVQDPTDQHVDLTVLAAAATHIDARVGPIADFNRFIPGFVTIRVDRSDGGCAELKSFIEGL